MNEEAIYRVRRIWLNPAGDVVWEVLNQQGDVVWWSSKLSEVEEWLDQQENER